jgi:hypothetical protein
MKDKPYAVFKTADKDITMTKENLARWLSLMEAFHFIEKKSSELGVNLDKKDWVKPLAFEKYIEQRFEGMMLDMEIDAREGAFDDIKFLPQREEELVVAPVD